MMKDRSQLLPALLALVLPLLAGVLLARLAPVPRVTETLQLRNVAAAEAVELQAIFDELGYEWPPRSPAGGVPPVAVRAMPTDIDQLDVSERKRLFFRILAPLVAAENRQLFAQRRFLQQTFETYAELPEKGPVANRVRRIASRFNVAGDLDRADVRKLLLRRVDIVPAALVLAQAANESGWGTSRFAREANNLFGMWTWDRSAGLAPRERSKEARHFVRVFDNLQEAVRNYLHTINVGPAYGELRELRELQRMRGERPDAISLAAGLVRYSARGEEYVAEIRDIITYNRLQELPPLELHEPDGDTLPAGQ